MKVLLSYPLQRMVYLSIIKHIKLTLNRFKLVSYSETDRMTYLTSFLPFSVQSSPHSHLPRMVYLGSLVIGILLTCLACDLEELTEAERDTLLNAPEEVMIEGLYYQMQVQLSDGRNSEQPSSAILVRVRLTKDSLEASDRWPTLDRYWVLNELDEDRVWTASFNEVIERGGNQIEGISRGAPYWIQTSSSPFEEAEPLVLIVQLKDQSQSYFIKSFL